MSGISIQKQAPPSWNRSLNATREAERQLLRAVQAYLGGPDVTDAQIAAAIESGPDAVANLMAGPEASEELLLGYKSAALKIMNAAGTGAYDALGLSISFNLDNPFSAPWVRAHGAELVSGVSDRTRDAIRQVVSDGFDQHLTVDEMTRQIRLVVGLLPKQVDAVNRYSDTLDDSEKSDRAVARLTEKYRQDRARNIARTETINAHAQGTLDAWRTAQSKGLVRVDAQKEWIAATASDRTCPICMGLDGKTAPLEGTFPGGYSAPTAHPSCRCALALKPGKGAFVGTALPEPEPPAFPSYPKIEPNLKFSEYIKGRNPLGGFVRDGSVFEYDGEFSKKRLFELLQMDAKRAVSGTEHVYPPDMIRAQLDMLLQKYGIYDQGGVNRTLAIRNLEGAYGQHAWNGKVFVDDVFWKKHKDKLKYPKNLSADMRDLLEKDFASTITHEIAHGASAATKEAYQGIGIWVEEVSTESVASTVIRKEFGEYLAYEDASEVIRSVSAYHDEYKCLFAPLRERLGFSEARETIFEASKLYKSRPHGSITSPQDALDGFLFDLRAVLVRDGMSNAEADVVIETTLKNISKLEDYA